MSSTVIVWLAEVLLASVVVNVRTIVVASSVAKEISLHSDATSLQLSDADASSIKRVRALNRVVGRNARELGCCRPQP